MFNVWFFRNEDLSTSIEVLIDVLTKLCYILLLIVHTKVNLNV